MKNIKSSIQLLALMMLFVGVSSCANNPSNQDAAQTDAATTQEAASAEAKYSIDSKIGDILDDPEAKAVLISYWPKASNPMIAGARGMSLRYVSQFEMAELTEDDLETINEGLAKMELNPEAE